MKDFNLLLVGVAIAVAIGIAGSVSVGGCETARDRASSGIGTLVDCEAPNLKVAVAELVPVFKAAVLKLIGTDAGKVDTDKLRAACAALVSDLPRCAMATAIAVLTAPAQAGQTVIAQPLLVPDPGALRAAFESVRIDWGGASYKTASGTL